MAIGIIGRNRLAGSQVRWEVWCLFDDDDQLVHFYMEDLKQSYTGMEWDVVKKIELITVPGFRKPAIACDDTRLRHGIDTI